MSEEEEEYYEDDDEPADDDEEDSGLPTWMLIALGLPLFFFMTWCGYVMSN